MSTSEQSTQKMNKMAELAKTFALASKKVVGGGTAETNIAPALAATLTILIVPSNAKTIKSWWP